MAANALQLEAFAAPGSLVAPPSHEASCDALLECLLARGYAVVEGIKWVEDDGALAAFWAAEQAGRAALQPLQPADGVGYRELDDDRQLLEHRVGPWMAQASPVLDSLHQANEGLEGAGRQLLSAALRGRLLRLPGSALSAALDDLPLPRHIWASSGMQCFSYGAASSGCQAHVDKGLLTLIWAPGHPGLEVCDPRGAWQAVPPTTPHQLVVLPGHTLEYATCGLVRAAQHRVVLGPGQERYSLAYKLAASPAAQINLLPALQAAGHMLPDARGERYPHPANVHSILQGFAATHPSVNAAVQRQAERRHAAEAGPGAPAAAAARLEIEAPAAAAAAEPIPAGAAAAVARPQARAAARRQARVAAALAPRRVLPARPGARAGPGRPGPAGWAAAPVPPPHQEQQQQPEQQEEQAPEQQQQPPPEQEQHAHAAPAQQARMRIVMAAAGASITLFVVPTTRWSDIVQAYCALRDIEPSGCRLMFDGSRIWGKETPAMRDMEDGDVVDVTIEQMGD